MLKKSGGAETQDKQRRSHRRTSGRGEDDPWPCDLPIKS